MQRNTLLGTNTALLISSIIVGNLVCHSIGGIVASKNFYEHDSDQKVDVIITCGTSYKGYFKLLDCALNPCGIGELMPFENYVKRIPIRNFSFNLNIKNVQRFFLQIMILEYEFQK